MFGIDAKEIFQQKISDVVVILFAIHIIAVTFTYIIKWIRPVLKKRAAEYSNKNSEYSSEYSLLLSGWSLNKNTKACHDCESHITDEEFLSVVENLKTVIEIAEDPTKAILDSSSLMRINNMSDSDFQNALNLGNYLRNLSERKCSSEAQTNITINPGIKLDFSCPQIACHDIPETGSSDSFLSLSSKDSSTDLKNELEQIINEFESNDVNQKEKIDEDITIKKLQKYLKESLSKNDVESKFVRSGTPMSQENKLLEMAIAEFEKELKPIKDQIQVLKECISGFDLINSNRKSLGIPSDFNSSLSGSGTFSERLSRTTCCSTDMQSYFSSYHIISTTSFGSVDTDSRYKNIKKLDKIAAMNSSKNKHKNNQSNKQSSVKLDPKALESFDTAEKCKPGKRSPIAEMYVKLSQSNSQSSCLLKGKKEKVGTSDNTVTYRIDLNVKLAGVPVSNSQKSKMPKERAIQPLTSDPDEIFKKSSNTDTSSGSTIK